MKMRQKKDIPLYQRIINSFQALSVLAIVAMMLVTLTDVGMRVFFKNSIMAAYTLQSLLLVIVVFGSVAVAYRERIFPSVKNIYNLLHRRAKMMLDIFTELIGLACCCLIIWLSIDTAVSAFQLGTRPNAVPGPLWPWKAFIPLGTSILCIEMIAFLINLRKNKRVDSDLIKLPEENI